MHQQVGATFKRVLLQKRLFGADVERRDLGDGIDQHLVVEPRDRRPIDGKAKRVAELARFLFNLCPLGDRQRVRLLIVERGNVDVGRAV